VISSAKAVAALSVGLLALLANRRSASASSATPGASSEYITEPARVRRVQEQLTALGYPTGWDPGVVNTPTLASVNQFLQDLGQPAVGGITPRVEALVLRVYELEQQRAGGSSSSTPSGPSSSPPTQTGTVVMDPLGGRVVTDRVQISNVQRWLTALGYDTGGVDGLVGRRTLAALHSFLADEGVDSRPSSITDAVVRLVRDAYGSGHLAGAPSIVGGATEDAPPPPSARDRRIASVLEATARRRARGRTTNRRY
jgi:peptidoglycan hydrolase-like protein with peptidoglycan-binding domain